MITPCGCGRAPVDHCHCKWTDGSGPDGLQGKKYSQLKYSTKWRKKANLGTGITANLKYLGFIHNNLGDSDLAIKYLNQTLAAAPEQNERHSEAQILKKMYQIYREKGKFKTERDYCERYIVVGDSTVNQETPNRIASIEIQAEIRDRKNAALMHENRITELERVNHKG